ncbi:MAG: flagellin [Syntrophomonas sp.]
MRKTTKLQLGANTRQNMSSSIANLNSEALGIDRLLVINNQLANRAIKSIDKAIQIVSEERSKLGAIQDRLDHASIYLSVWAENLTSAESKIRDADIAKESINFARDTILANTVSAMMAQAIKIRRWCCNCYNNGKINPGLTWGCVRAIVCQARAFML